MFSPAKSVQAAGWFRMEKQLSFPDIVDRLLSFPTQHRPQKKRAMLDGAPEFYGGEGSFPTSQNRDVEHPRVEAGQYFTIAVNESGLRLAPPTSAPSISSWPQSAVALSGLTLPP